MGHLEHLWAGWRSDFVVGAGAADGGDAERADRSSAVSSADGPTGTATSCVFCRIMASGLPDKEVHIIWRHPGGLTVAIMNAYPYTSGHFMLMPVRHVGELEDLSPEEGQSLWEGLLAGTRAVKAAYQPEGVNLGANLGRAAGAGVPGHFHMHVVPRWTGDTNFMTSVADARVLPEPLSESGAKLRSSWPH